MKTRLVLVALLLAGCADRGARPTPSGSAATAVTAGNPLNVLLITIDTLRFDAMSASVTPWMQRLAESGVRFEEAHAHNVVTLPSHANILSGRYPLDHGVHDNSGYRFPTSEETMATLLKSRGYRTAAFVSAFPLDSRFGLDRGFDVYEDSFAEATPRPAFQVQERSARDTIELAARWIGRSIGGAVHDR